MNKDHVKGAADKEGYEPDGAVTVDELVEYLDKKLTELVRACGPEEVGTNVSDRMDPDRDRGARGDRTGSDAAVGPAEEPAP